jgi:hypothetical protein
MVGSFPTPGMIPTAVGSGGPDPTRVLPGADTSAGIEASGYVPTTPSLFLKPSRFTTYGIPTGEEAAYWKVWWNGTSQTKAVVSLQQRDSSRSASTELVGLVARNSNTANFTSADFRVTNTYSFLVSGVPGATGLVWDATEGQGSDSLPIEFRFAVFHRGSVVALVSMTSYARATDASGFLTFADSQYARMSAAPPFNFVQLILYCIELAGVALVISAVIVKLARRKPRPVPPWSAPHLSAPYLWPSGPPPWPGPLPPDGETTNPYTG